MKQIKMPKARPGRKRLGTHPMTPAERQRRARARREKQASSYHAEAEANWALLNDLLGTLEDFLETMSANSVLDRDQILSQLLDIVTESKKTRAGVEAIFEASRDELEGRLPLK